MGYEWDMRRASRFLAPSFAGVTALAIAALLAGAPPPAAGQEPAPEPSARPGDGGPSLKAQPPSGGSVRMQGMFSEDEARARVERGLVDPWFADLGKALLRSWDVGRLVRSRPALAADLNRNAEAYGKEWSERASAYGQTGSPLPANAPNPKVPETYGIVAPGNEVVMQGQATQLVHEQHHVVRRAIVRVVQNAKGELHSAELEASSGDPELDAAALYGIRSAAATLPRPPPRLAEGRDFVSSEWQFDLVVAVTPLAPVFTFEFDEALGSADAKVPLTRKVHKRVRLLAVP
jgi:TonB C terminal